MCRVTGEERVGSSSSRADRLLAYGSSCTHRSSSAGVRQIDVGTTAWWCPPFVSQLVRIKWVMLSGGMDHGRPSVSST